MPEAAPLAPFGHSEQNGVCFRELIPSPSLSNFRLNASSRQLATTATTTLVAWSPTCDQRPRDQKPYMVANIRPAGRVVANLRPRPRPLWSRGRQHTTSDHATKNPIWSPTYGQLVAWSPTCDHGHDHSGRVVANLRPRSRPLWSPVATERPPGPSRPLTWKIDAIFWWMV